MKKLLILIFSILLLSFCITPEEQIFKIPKKISARSSANENIILINDSVSILKFSSENHSEYFFGKYECTNDTTIEFISTNTLSFGVCKSIMWGKRYLTLYYNGELKDFNSLLRTTDIYYQDDFGKRYEIDTLPYERKIDLDNITFHAKPRQEHDSISFDPLRTSMCVYETKELDTIQIQYSDDSLKLIKPHLTITKSFEITEIIH